MSRYLAACSPAPNDGVQGDGEPGQVTPWGPYAGPPPFAPPFAPDFEAWFAEEARKHPGYDRQTAYFHFYDLAGEVDGLPGYTATEPA